MDEVQAVLSIFTKEQILQMPGSGPVDEPQQSRLGFPLCQATKYHQIRGADSQEHLYG